jgi:hypothetical protein
MITRDMPKQLSPSTNTDTHVLVAEAYMVRPGAFRAFCPSARLGEHQSVTIIAPDTRHVKHWLGLWIQVLG